MPREIHSLLPNCILDQASLLTLGGPGAPFRLTVAM